MTEFSCHNAEGFGRSDLRTASELAGGIRWTYIHACTRVANVCERHAIYGKVLARLEEGIHLLCGFPGLDVSLHDRQDLNIVHDVRAKVEPEPAVGVLGQNSSTDLLGFSNVENCSGRPGRPNPITILYRNFLDL